MHKQALLVFGQVIRNIRQDKHISQEDLADKCGLHRTYISDIELGKRNVSFENMIKISHALNIKLSDIIREVENNESL